MNTKAIAFTASEQTLVKTSGADAYASNTVGYIEATFDLDTNWDGFDSVRAVWKSQYYTISAVLDAYGKCLVPAEVKYYKSKVFVNLVGSNVEDDVLVDRLTTYPVLAFTIDAEAEVEGTETTDITPSQFEQFVDQVEGYAESAAEDAQSIAESAAQIEQNAEDIADLKEEINDKPNWTVGSAEQIVSDEASATDTTPYTFRRSGGGLIPFNFTREELSKVVGGTVGWNQLVPNTTISSKTDDGITFTVNSNGTVTFSGTATDAAEFRYGRIDYIKGHKYAEFTGASASIPNGVTLRIFGDLTSNNRIKECTNSDYWNSMIKVASGTAITTPITVSLLCFDLTAMLGTTIADYIYSLETATAGSGIAKLREWGFFRDSYYSYDSGSLQSVCVGAHVMRDADDNVIGNYALDSTKTLRGRFYLDSNNQLRADGDIYLPSGEVQRKMVQATFDGSESWAGQGTGSKAYFKLKVGDNGSVVNNAIISNKIVQADVRDATEDVGINLINSSGYNGAFIYIRPNDVANTSLATFKTWLSNNPLTVAYELATPTTESADPYTAVQICDSDGTEEFVDALVEAGTRDVAIPSGTETVYYENMASKLAELPPIPSAPSTNGTYTLQAVVSSGAVTYQWTS